MTNYVELPHNKKLNLLRAHSMGCEWPDLDQEHWCLHCGKKFSGHSVRVWRDEKGSLWLECGTPDCNGSPIDWAPYPWWDEDQPSRKRTPPRKRKPKGKGPTQPGPDDDVPF
jgi:hypothetical protein